MDFYHVLNRGVQKTDIVKDDSDRMRFVHSLFIFNDRNYTDPNHRKANAHKNSDTRDCIVHIHAWCLMNNHYHLLLSPVDDDIKNISLFMKKLNMGYAKYFNEKYDRSGYLWQGKYKKILLERDAHFMYIPYYIHLNPLDYTLAKWRTGEVKNCKVAHEHLAKYRWSSHKDYWGEHNFPSVIETKVLNEMLMSKQHYKSTINTILSSEILAEESLKIEP